MTSEFAYAQSGSYSSNVSTRKGGFVRAGVYEENFIYGLADAKLSIMTTSANAEFNPVLDARFKIAAGMSLNLATIEFSLGAVNLSYGIKICTGFSAGVDGVELSFLGSGFSFGPKKIILKTPICDVGLNPNVIFTLLLAFIYSIDISEISAEALELYEFLIDAIKKFFGGRPPPPPPSMSGALLLETIQKKQLEYEKEQKISLEQLYEKKQAILLRQHQIESNRINRLLVTTASVGEALLSSTISTIVDTAEGVTNNVGSLLNWLTTPFNRLAINVANNRKVNRQFASLR